MHLDNSFSNYSVVAFISFLIINPFHELVKLSTNDGPARSIQRVPSCHTGLGRNDQPPFRYRSIDALISQSTRR